MLPRILPHGIALLLLPAVASSLEGQGGKATELRKGTNGFTCALIPDESLAPVCADDQGWRWLVAAFSNKPKPDTTQSGIAYMAKGGLHFGTPHGKIVMQPTPETKKVDEPPHWMILWPVDPAKTALPTQPIRRRRLRDVRGDILRAHGQCRLRPRGTSEPC